MEEKEEKSFNYSYVDMFAIPVSLFATRRKQFSGSLPGFILTLQVLSVIIGYIYYKSQRMIVG